MSIKKISTILWAVIFAIVLSIFLELIISKDTSRETLNEYLLALKNNNTNKALLLSTDERFSSNYEEKSFQEKVGKYDEIKDFKILEQVENNINSKDSVIIAEIEFQSGEITKREFKIKKDDYDGYKVVISSLKPNIGSIEFNDN